MTDWPEPAPALGKAFLITSLAYPAAQKQPTGRGRILSADYAEITIKIPAVGTDMPALSVRGA